MPCGDLAVRQKWCSRGMMVQEVWLTRVLYLVSRSLSRRGQLFFRVPLDSMQPLTQTDTVVWPLRMGGEREKGEARAPRLPCRLLLTIHAGSV